MSVNHATVAIRFFRHLVGLQDEFYVKQVIEKRLLGPILDVLIDTLPRDNLLSSACLELFNFVRHAEIKDLKKYLVETYRDRLMSLAYMELFRDMVLKYDQTRGFTSADATLFEPDEDVTGRRTNTQGRRLIEPVADAVEDDSEYFNTSDDEEDQATKSHGSGAQANGVTTPGKLVDYDSDEQGDDEAAQSKENVEAGGTAKPSASKGTDAAAGSNRQTGAAAAPPERISEKRRREEDEEEDLGKTITSKRRNSTSASSNPSPTSGFLRKRKSLSNTKDSSGSAPKKIAITISSGGKRASSQAGGSSQDDVT